MRRLLSMMILFLGVASSAPGFAQAPALEAVLSAIDTVPTREALDQALPDARAQLMAAARDSERGIYARHRAITLLSLYSDSETRVFLERLATESVESEMRKMAVYTLGRAYGAQPDSRLVPFLADRIEKDDSVVVQEWAVRSLRWVAGSNAERLLRDVAETGAQSLRPIAVRALRKRVASVEKPVR